MIVTILILAISVGLLVYWFRFCCLGLLRNSAEEPLLVPGNRFNFPGVRERLQTESDLDPLQQSLDRDYRIVSYLLRHAAGLGGHLVRASRSHSAGRGVDRRLGRGHGRAGQ